MLNDDFCVNDDYKVDTVGPAAYYVPEFVTHNEEKSILSSVYAVPKPKWTQLSNRRVQNWGGIPHNKGMIAESMPSWLDVYLKKIDSLNLMGSNKPNHVLVNEYLPGQGILPHLDGSLFYPTITTISVGSHTVLQFLEPSNENEMILRPVFSFLLEPRSLLVLKEKLYSYYLHCIEEVDEDVISESIANLHLCSGSYEKGTTIKRGTRVSLTIRHVPNTTSFKLKIGNRNYN